MIVECLVADALRLGSIICSVHALGFEWGKPLALRAITDTTRSRTDSHGPLLALGTSGMHARGILGIATSGGSAKRKPFRALHEPRSVSLDSGTTLNVLPLQSTSSRLAARIACYFSAE